MESSVDEMDDPDDLKNKLNRIKAHDLIMERKRRQSQEVMNRNSVKASVFLKQTGINIGLES